MGKFLRFGKEAFVEWWDTKWIEKLHSVYIFLAVIGYFLVPLGNNPSTKELVFQIFFGIYFVFLLILFTAMGAMYSRKSRYPETYRLVHQVFHHARDAYDELEQCCAENQNFDKKRIKDILTGALTSVSTAFSIATTVSCRASIKLIGRPNSTCNEKDFYLQTLARDSTSSVACKSTDEKEGQDHKLVNNSDFSLIFNRKKDYFFSNDLSECDNYYNSRLDSIRNSGAKADHEWELMPYKSTIVCPIRFVPDGIDEKDDNKSDCEDNNSVRLYGFLTIDAPHRQVFDKNIDVQMAAAIADALYPVLDMYRKAKLKNSAITNQSNSRRDDNAQ